MKAWKEGGYSGVTATTRALLNFWFRAEHRMPDRRKFEYHNAQREAIETLIYVYEVCGVRTQKNLIETFSQTENLKLLHHDIFPRYCLKMATGSGKTKVMALAIVWQYFNALLEDEKNFARTFLIMAPNVIVYERLKTDFGDGKIFIFDPLIPNELSFL